MDVIQADEVLTNLLENAVKYTPPGTPLDISARELNKAIEVAVADRGPGIPMDHISQLFSRFYRVTAGSAGAGGAKGTGLGLAIVKGIVEAHGGEVSAANRPGGGAIFKFTLPLDAESGDTDPSANIPTEEATASSAQTKKEAIR
jgi:two-component system sensor histidine kinase KdpD